MSEHTFVVEKNCPICGKTTRVVKTKSRLMVIKTDEDFCNHYSDGFNPYFYNIWVCEHCGFAADEKHFLGSFMDKVKDAMQAKLTKNPIPFHFMEERHMPDAVASYKLAIYFAEEMGAPMARIAGMYLRMAWLFRSSGEKEKEEECMRKAVFNYERSRLKERYPMESLTDASVTFLIAAIYKRLGNEDMAASYLNVIINDKQVKYTDNQTYERARRMWQDIREDKKAAEEAEKKAKKAAAIK